MNFIISANTDVGIKKSTNQDSVLIRKYNTDQGEVVFAIVCDGMGGLEKGEVASASVVNAFATWADQTVPYLHGTLNTELVENRWRGLIVEMNEKIKSYGRKNNVSLGTTVTAILLTPTQYCAVNVGDTRAYEITSGDFRLITKDHSLVQREIDQGILTEEQAKTDPRRSVLLQCCGASDTVVPDFFYGDVKANAVYMLCTDGFRHEITPEEICQAIAPEMVVDEASMYNNIQWLIELNKSREEKDNISAAMIRTF